jgi:hypothetical protein
LHRYGPEEDLKKQRMYERVHRMTFRKRNAANDFGDPDEVEDLMLDIDRKALPPPGALTEGGGAGNSLGKAEAGAEGSEAAAAASEVNGDGDVKNSDDKDDDKPDGWNYAAERASKARGGGKSQLQELGYLTPMTGNYLNLVLGEDRFAAAATAASGTNNAEAAAGRCTSSRIRLRPIA